MAARRCAHCPRGLGVRRSSLSIRLGCWKHVAASFGLQPEHAARARGEGADPETRSGAGLACQRALVRLRLATRLPRRVGGDLPIAGRGRSLGVCSRGATAGGAVAEPSQEQASSELHRVAARCRPVCDRRGSLPPALALRTALPWRDGTRRSPRSMTGRRCAIRSPRVDSPTNLVHRRVPRICF